MATALEPNEIARVPDEPSHLQTSDAVSVLAAGTAELAAGTEEAQAAVEVMNSTMRGVGDIAAECKAAALQSLNGAREIEVSASGAVGATQALVERATGLRQMVSSMNSEVYRLIDWVNLSVDGAMKSARLIGGLEQLSTEIGEIVEAVSEIADQTNLLAFNAAIEAARAGKHGLGFAVVAEEVRDLAEVSGHAAEDIMGLVAAIQNDVRRVSESVSNIGQHATEEAKKAGNIAQDLTEIDSGMEQLTQGARDIQGMARANVNASGEMRAACQAMTDSVDRAAAASAEIGAAVDSQVTMLEEIAGAAGALAQSTEELRLGNQGYAATGISAKTSDLRVSISQTAASAEQIAAGVAQIDQSAHELVSSATQNLAGARSVDSAASQALEITKTAASVSARVNELLERNNRNVANLVQAIRNAAGENQSAVESIERLEERAREIDKIVDVIVTVTTQTNLLALHGAIEAARAGRRGRGFAVVASDVRALARESSAAADKIKMVVRNIQSQILRVTRDVETAGRSAQIQAEDANRSTANLTRIQQDTNLIHNDFTMIAQLAAADVNRARDVVSAMERVAALADRLGELTTEASSAGAETAKGMQELARAVDDIATTAQQL